MEGSVCFLIQPLEIRFQGRMRIERNEKSVKEKKENKNREGTKSFFYFSLPDNVTHLFVIPPMGLILVQGITNVVSIYLLNSVVLK